MYKKIDIKNKLLVWTLLTVSALWLTSCTDKDDKKVVDTNDAQIEDTKTSDTNVEVASAKDTVLVHYTWKLKDGKVFDSSTGKKPLEFIIDAGWVIVWLNEWVKGMKVWEKKTIVIPVKDAYGPVTIERTIPAALLDPTNKKSPFYGKELKSGMKSNWANWIPTIEIISVNDDKKTITVKQDNTHPLAWKELTFDLELVEIKSNKKVEKVDTAKTSISDKIKDKANAVKDWVTDTVDTAKKAADKVVDTASKTVDTAKKTADKVVDTATKTVDTVKKTADKVVDTASKTVDTIKDWADKAVETTKEIAK